MKTLSPALARAYVEVSSSRPFFRRTSRSHLLRLCGILVCGLAAGLAGAATPASAPAASASSIIGKGATLNGSPMAAGATLFPGDVIHLGESSTAALRFGNNLVLAAAGTELVVEPGGVRLRDGFLQVRAGGSEPFGVSGPFFHVNVAAAGGIPSSAEVHVTGARAQISAIAGAADLTSARSLEPLRLQAGETANLDATGAAPAPAQTAPNPDAGQISRLAPQVQIDRGSQHIVAAVSDRVFWNDDLRSGPTGRAHVTLKDGSQLNLGSDSSLRILQHDAGAQQTSLDLLVGRLRARITKLSRPGGKFEIHTPMGIAGLVGTDFSLLVTTDYTELMVFDGSVRFTPASGAAVVVSAGMKARFSRAGLADGPVAAGPQEIQTAKDLTDVVGNANQVAAAGAGRPLAPLVITLTGVAAGIGIGVWQATRPTMSVFVP
jgi:ferric-dicitrate binding protein FerR (iron transport regulator)